VEEGEFNYDIFKHFCKSHSVLLCNNNMIIKKLKKKKENPKDVFGFMWVTSINNYHIRH
jgi:hypothetical protein